VKNLIETLSVFCITVIAVAWLRYNEVPGSSVFIPLIWSFGALLPGVWGESVISLAGLTQRHLAGGLKYFFLSTLVLLPLSAGGLLLYKRMGMPMLDLTIPRDVTVEEWVIYQFTMVAVFEELFFRGYIQRQFERVAVGLVSREMMIFWFPVVASAFLFALAHMIVELNVAGFVVFFPGLLFAWLRAKTGSLLPPVLAHGSANVFALFLIRAFS
jgi:membrane protease YdiL (CAAX protease family)